jgi:hypothetical protein
MGSDVFLLRRECTFIGQALCERERLQLRLVGLGEKFAQLLRSSDPRQVAADVEVRVLGVYVFWVGVAQQRDHMGEAGREQIVVGTARMAGQSLGLPVSLLSVSFLLTVAREFLSARL